MAVITQIHPVRQELPPHLSYPVTYHFVTMSRRPLVVRITDPSRPRSCTFIVTQLHTGELVCSCPAFAEDRRACQHTIALAADMVDEINFRERLADRRAAELYNAGQGLKSILREG